MKKLFLSLIAVAVGTLGCFAQDELVATLNHGTELSTFSGEDALAQAYEAAENGDVITLSSGVFTGVNMKKAITLRGAGYKPMTSNGYVSTQITGSMFINIPTDASMAFTIEGIDFLNEVTIVSEKMASSNIHKSLFRGAVTGNGVTMHAVSCIFKSSLNALCYMQWSTWHLLNSTLYCNNCVINHANSEGLYNNKLGKIVANNCIIQAYALPYSVLVNSIIISRNNASSYPLEETCTAQNCVGINGVANGSDGTKDVFQNIANPANIMIEGNGQTAYSNIFKTFKDIGQISLYETFQLTDEAAAQYLGEDGTQVGIYGGNAPFNPNLTNPQVTKFTVNSTTENGQLKVKINVE